MIVRFIDENKDRYGVEPMCAQLAELGCAFAPSTYYDARLAAAVAARYRRRVSHGAHREDL